MNAIDKIRTLYGLFFAHLKCSSINNVTVNTFLDLEYRVQMKMRFIHEIKNRRFLNLQMLEEKPVAPPSAGCPDLLILNDA